MLVDISLYEGEGDLKKILDVIAQVNGNKTEVIHHQTGIYEIGHFNFGHFCLETIERYPEFDTGFDCYGVCDNYEQILEHCPEIVMDKDRKFVISITSILKKNQSKEGGWRWHKWGPYIGKHKITREYLYDEPKIEKVFCYHVYEIKKLVKDEL